jgi:drug/metabolite transporter (DMT)-like permease
VTSPTPAAGNLRGIVLMTLAMAGFAVEDMFMKAAAARGVPVGQMLILFGLGGAAAFAVLVARAGQSLAPAAMLSRPMLAKVAFEVSGRAGHTLALALAPMATTVAILQAAPLVVTLGAALLFGEAVGWRRWLAIAVGLSGVMLVLRPGAGGFEWTSLFALVGMIGFAGRDLATRAAPPGLSNLQLGLYGFLAMAPPGAVMALWGGVRPVDATAAACLAGAVLFGVAGYYGLTAAMRTGEIGAVAPFRYTRLVFALILAVVVFGERPDAVTLIGASLIVASGVYAVLRERLLRRPAASRRGAIRSG